MIPIRDLSLSEPLRHMSPEAALSLTRGVHRHLDPHALLRELWSQAESLTRATGLAYFHPGQQMDVVLGDGPHGAGYTLSHQGEALGELELKFARPVSQEVAGIAGEMLALAMPALHNALTHRDLARRTAPTATGTPLRPQAAPVSAGRKSRPDDGESPEAGCWDDALVLVGLDGFGDIRTAHGEPWAQTLVQTVQSQIHEGLRDADSVFQIDEGLLAVLLPRTSEEAAMDVAGKIATLIASLHLRDGRLTRELTACMGVVGAGNAGNPENVLDQARAALSQAQQEGVNTIRAYRTTA